MWENTRGDARGAEPAVAGRRPDRLRLLDLRTGRVTTPASRSRRHVVEAVQRPGGGPIALLTWPVPEPYPGLLGAELHVWDPVSGTTLDLGPAGVEASSLAWWKADDGWHLAYLAVTPPAVLDVSVPAAPRQAVRRRNLTAGADVCPTDLVQVADGAPLVVFADGLDTAISEGVADPDRLGMCPPLGSARVASVPTARLRTRRLGAHRSAPHASPRYPRPFDPAGRRCGGGTASCNPTADPASRGPG